MPEPQSPSGIDPLKSSWKRDGFPHVLDAAQPAYDALDPHSKTSVRYRAISAQIQVPFESLLRKLVFIEFTLEGLEVVTDGVGLDGLHVRDIVAFLQLEDRRFHPKIQVVVPCSKCRQERSLRHLPCSFFCPLHEAVE